MATIWQDQILNSLKSSLTTGAYSDLSITCCNDVYKVHKVVVCDQVRFFARAVEFGGQETQDSIISLPEDEPEIVELLMQYLYEGEYNPVLFSDAAPTGSSSQLLIHTKMYEMADKYEVVGLKELAKEKFSRSCMHFWDTSDFPVAANHVFLTTPENDEGLRDVVSQTIAKNMALIREPEIRTLLIQFNSLALGILDAKSEEQVKVRKQGKFRGRNACA